MSYNIVQYSRKLFHGNLRYAGSRVAITWKVQATLGSHQIYILPIILLKLILKCNIQDHIIMSVTHISALKSTRTILYDFSFCQ